MNKYEMVLLILLAFLQFADIVITFLGLQLFPFTIYERDPFTAFLIDQVGMGLAFSIKALLVMLFLGMFMLIGVITDKIRYEKIRSWLTIVRIGLIGAFSLSSAIIVYNNIVVLLRVML